MQRDPQSSGERLSNALERVAMDDTGESQWRQVHSALFPANPQGEFSNPATQRRREGAEGRETRAGHRQQGSRRSTSPRIHAVGQSKKGSSNRRGSNRERLQRRSDGSSGTGGRGSGERGRQMVSSMLTPDGEIVLTSPAPDNSPLRTRERDEIPPGFEERGNLSAVLRCTFPLNGDQGGTHFVLLDAQDKGLYVGSATGGEFQDFPMRIHLPNANLRAAERELVLEVTADDEWRQSVKISFRTPSEFRAWTSRLHVIIAASLANPADHAHPPPRPFFVLEPANNPASLPSPFPLPPSPDSVSDNPSHPPPPLPHHHHPHNHRHRSSPRAPPPSLPAQPPPTSNGLNRRSRPPSHSKPEAAADRDRPLQNVQDAKPPPADPVLAEVPNQNPSEGHGIRLPPPAPARPDAARLTRRGEGPETAYGQSGSMMPLHSSNGGIAGQGPLPVSAPYAVGLSDPDQMLGSPPVPRASSLSLPPPLPPSSPLLPPPPHQGQRQSAWPLSTGPDERLGGEGRGEAGGDTSSRGGDESASDGGLAMTFRALNSSPGAHMMHSPPGAHIMHSPPRAHMMHSPPGAHITAGMSHGGIARMVGRLGMGLDEVQRDGSGGVSSREEASPFGGIVRDGSSRRSNDGAPPLPPLQRHTYESGRSSRRFSQLSRRTSLVEEEEQGLKVMEFPFGYLYNAVPLEMTDILEDGAPPRPRAGKVTQLDVALAIMLPDSIAITGSAGKQLMVEVTYNLASFRVGHSGAGFSEATMATVDCMWGEYFSLSFSEHSVKQAQLMSAEAAAREPAQVIRFEVTSYETKRNCEIHGQAVTLVREFLNLTTEASPKFLPLVDRDGRPVYDAAGRPLQLAIRAYAVTDTKTPTWHPPTLQESITACERPSLLQSTHHAKDEPLHSSLDSMEDSKAHAKSEERQRLIPKKVVKSGMYRRLRMKSADASEDDDDEEQKLSERLKDQYWKESLEQAMDSLVMNLVVMALVVLDVVTIFIFTFVSPTEEGELDPPVQVALTSVVLGLFLFELSLRQLAKGRRFWWNRWNIFDFVVIWASVMMAAAKYYIDYNSENGSGGIQAAKSTTTTLRIISRVAMALRVIRVLVKLRMARKLSGHVTRNLRTAVSQNKRRYTKHGFDLDLTYITDRIMAMSAPAFGGHTAYRNDIHVVSRFLSLRHYGSFFVFNLCDTYTSSDGVMGNYHPQMLFNQVLRIAFEDHGPPLLVEMVVFCSEAAKWLARDSKNTIAVHCKGGKGRTGVMIAALILWTGHRRCAMDAMELFTFRRTANYDPEAGIDGTVVRKRRKGKENRGVDGPSQQRYVHYMEAMLYSGLDALGTHRILLASICMPVGQAQSLSGWNVSFTIKCMRTLVYDSWVRYGKSTIPFKGEPKEMLDLPLNILIWGDTRVEFFMHQKDSRKARKLQWFLVFNTAFYKGKDEIVFEKSKVDMLHKDAKCEKADDDYLLTFKVTDSAVGSPIMKAEHSLAELFQSRGTKLTFERNETIIDEAAPERCLLMVTNGVVEGVVTEDFDTGEYHYHPTGSCIPDGSPVPVRVPTMSIKGSSTVLGMSQFLSFRSISVRARTRVEVWALRKAQRGSTYIGDVASPRGGAVLGEGKEGSDSIELELEGIGNDELPAFYRAVASNLAVQLSRATTENIRISGLKALNDRQSVMHLQDEKEVLRVQCIKQFGLPVNEKLAMYTKCWLSSREFKNKRMRVILLSAYLVLDPSIFGPAISSNSTIYRLDQLHSVKQQASDDDLEQYSLLLAMLGDQIRGLNLQTTMDELEVTMQSQLRFQQMQALLQDMCERAADVRERDAEHPFETPMMTRLLERCSRVHQLKKGEELREANTTDSLFIVRAGGVNFSREKDVYKILREGSSFGESDFIHQTISGQYTVSANTSPTTVLELPREAVSEVVNENPVLGARFYFTICQVIERGLRDALEATFPGTWSRKRKAFHNALTPLITSSGEGQSHNYSSRLSGGGESSPG